MHVVPLLHHPTKTKAIVYRSLLLLAAVAIFFLGRSSQAWLQIAAILLLLLAALFIQPLLEKKIPGWLLMVLAGLLAGGLSGSWILALLLPLVSCFTFFFDKAPAALIAADGITLLNPPLKKHYAWAQLSNAVVKDGLLTIDCQNNQLLQLETTLPLAEEKLINDYLAQALAKNI
jgi:hypothetical protein